jgi:toxin HigB-1
MLKSEFKRFRDKDAESLVNDEEVIAYKNIQVSVRKKLELLLSSQSLKDLALVPGNRLEKLSGHKKNLYSIRINQQYRILFL